MKGGKPVSTSFTGERLQRMDGKGRLVIPAAFRDALRLGDPVCRDGESPRMVVNYGNHLTDHLRIYSMASFGSVEAMIGALSPADRNKRNLSYVYLTQREIMSPDKEGRIILTAELRAKLRLDEGDLRIMGLGDYLEIWSEATFAEARGKEIDSWLATLPPGADPLAFALQPGGV